MRSKRDRLYARFSPGAFVAFSTTSGAGTVRRMREGTKLKRAGRAFTNGSLASQGSHSTSRTMTPLASLVAQLDIA